MDTSETGCCPRFDPAGWDGEEFEFRDRPFVRATTVNFLYVPLNMGSMIGKTWKKIEQAGAAPQGEFLILSHDLSPWRAEHFFAVTKDVPGAEMVRLSGSYLTKVFEGPYRDAGKWVGQMKEHAHTAGRELKRLYFFYTTCPKCAKQLGKNYVVAFAEV
jgi:hypothetical protein